ncbi:hypothetical protein PV729_41370 [Streptomyces europaeiscabiei]|uniref:Secreted protein n=1 Tax=Streptomyces europaeiscabiei TaxID=146819 RepID=A0ABU4NV33_9ACTN|nr:hypothetical protein [Streptomyces europaeiscabiei]MDX3548688.1 hypothetical protein [Streptomyces europaeiscabiei]MDX3558101.1 hypothetical protein [Streptomyces europaeiscabiei]MDX3706801.1 hypothetical protein [Streptomyces europaeiscabiei]
MKIRRTLVLAAAAVTLGGGLALAPAASAASAVSAGEAAAQAMSCSTTRLGDDRASGWCSGGRDWRVGVRCGGHNYYSEISSVRGTKYARCGSGTMTHRWIDQW